MAQQSLIEKATESGEESFDMTEDTEAADSEDMIGLW